MDTLKFSTLIDSKSLPAFKKFLDQKPKTVILAHANPDGDTIGASLTLYQALKEKGFEVRLVCKDKPPEQFSFLPFIDVFEQDFNENEFEAVIFTDCGDKRMTRFHEEKPRILSSDMLIINIDHHPTNDLFGNINFVATKAASSTQIVFELLQKLGVLITPQMATCLLLGLYTDTGSFMHQNTTPEAYKAAGDLIQLGGNMSRIAKNVFQSYELKTLKLWGKVLDNLYVTPEGAAIVGVSRKEYESIGATREDLGGVIDYVNSIPEVQYSVLLSEDEKGNVKASLRTRKNEVDVKTLAEKFGGGGHIKASGFTVRGGHLEKEVKWKIIQD